MKPKQAPRPPQHPKANRNETKSAQGRNVRLSGGAKKDGQGLRERPKPPINVMLYGQHPVVEALRNPARRAKTLWLDQAKQDELTRQFEPILAAHANPPAVQWTSRDYIAQTAQGEATQSVPHQGVMLKCAPLKGLEPDTLGNLPSGSLIMALDQVNDPHNVGAIIRSAAAFKAAALLTTDRHTPYESGLLAKTASGGLERLPWCRAGNLGDTLEELKKAGFFVVGLDGNTDNDFSQLPTLTNERVVLVMGAEGKGLRERTKGLLDFHIRLPTDPGFPHLNVSNAAAIALYDLSARLNVPA